MKINFKEYEDMVVQFNLYVYRWMYTWLLIIAFGVSFMASSFKNNEYLINLIVYVVIGIVSSFVVKKAIGRSAKKVNGTNKIIEIETTISEDGIIEKVTTQDNVESTNEYRYKDLVKVREDKYNFYLFITNKQAIVISKQKLENIELFRNLIKEKCAIIDNGKKVNKCKKY